MDISEWTELGIAKLFTSDREGLTKVSLCSVHYAPRGTDYRRATQPALDRVRAAALGISKLEYHVSRARSDVMT